MELFQFVLIFFMIIGGFALGFWYLYQRQQRIERGRQDRVEKFSRLTDKFSSANEFVEFLRSDEGKKFLDDPVSSRSNPHLRVLRFLQAGIASLFLGAGFFFNALRLRPLTDINYVHQEMDSEFFGLFTVFIGIGLLVIAYVTHVYLKKWVLNGTANEKR